MPSKCPWILELIEMFNNFIFKWLDFPKFFLQMHIYETIFTKNEEIWLLRRRLPWVIWIMSFLEVKPMVLYEKWWNNFTFFVKPHCFIKKNYGIFRFHKYFPFFFCVKTRVFGLVLENKWSFRFQPPLRHLVLLCGG